MKKPELVSTARSLDELKKVIELGADAVIVGHSSFALRPSGDMNLEQIAQAITWAHERNRKLYVAVNQLFDQHQIADLPRYLNALSEFQVDAIEFSDPAVLMVNRTLTKPLHLHWNGEMTATNEASALFWAECGAKRTVLARELNAEQIQLIRKQTHMEIQIQVHGIMNMYHSKRRLLESYWQAAQFHIHPEGTSHEQTMPSYANQDGWVIVERERTDQEYPIFQDETGTHIMSAEDICMVDNLPEILELHVDSFKLEGLMKSENYQAAVVKSYRTAIDTYCQDPQKYQFDPTWLSNIQQLQNPNRELTYGFFYKEQVY